MFRFTPQTIPSNIFVIGGGGTGSRLMPMLTQFMRSITRGVSPTGWVEKPTIWVVDDDTVEQKNLLRQNFIQSDVGKPKAVVLAERYGRAYDVDVVPIVKRVDGTSNFHQAVSEILEAKRAVSTVPTARDTGSLGSVLNSSLVIICVDSAEARRHILNNFITSRKSATIPGAFFIDAGNEDSFGQVNFFTPTIIYGANGYDTLTETQKLPKFIGSVCDVDYVPMDPEYYRNLVDTPAQGSCADLNQTLAINAMMATTIMGVVQNYYYRKPFTYNCIRLSLDGANATEYNTFNHFKRVCLQNEAKMNEYYENHCFSTAGSKIKLTFANRLQFVHLISHVYTSLKTKIAQDEEETAAQRRKEALEQRKAELETARKALKARSDRGEVSLNTKVTVAPFEGAAPRPRVMKTKVVAGEVEITESVPSLPLPPLVVAEVVTEAPARPPARRRNAQAPAVPVAVVPDAWTESAPHAEVDLMARAVESVQALPRNRRT